MSLSNHKFILQEHIIILTGEESVLPHWFFSKAIAQVSCAPSAFFDIHNKKKTQSPPWGPLNAWESLPHPQEVLCEVYKRPLQHPECSNIPSSFPLNAQVSRREVMVSFNPLSAARIPALPPPHLFACVVRVCRCAVRIGSAESWSEVACFYLPTPRMDTQSEECLDMKLNAQTSKHLCSELLCAWSQSAAFGLTEFMQITCPCGTPWDKRCPSHQELGCLGTCQPAARCVHRRHFWAAVKPVCWLSGNLQDVKCTTEALKILGKSFKGPPVCAPRHASLYPHLLFCSEGKMNYSKTFWDLDHYSTLNKCGLLGLSVNLVKCY